MGIIVARTEDVALRPEDFGAGGVAGARRKRTLSADAPFAQLASAAAGSHAPLHSHSEPEVMVVLSGTVEVAGTVCGPGTIIHIPAMEEYSLTIGDEDLLYVIMRPRDADRLDPATCPDRAHFFRTAHRCRLRVRSLFPRSRGRLPPAGLAHGSARRSSSRSWRFR